MHACMCVRMCPLTQDGLELHHWRREADQGKPYPYAKLNKSLDTPSYTNEEYKVRMGVVNKGGGANCAVAD